MPQNINLSFLPRNMVITLDALMNNFCISPIQMNIFGAAHRWGEARGPKKPPPPPIKSVNISYNDETWRSFTLTKEDPKNV